MTDLPSRTSILVAAGRAIGAREKDSAVRNPDSLIEQILGPEERDLIREHPISAALAESNGRIAPYEVMTIAAMMQVRTCVIDEKLSRAIAAGATQVVLLGAGLDLRARRLADLLKNTRVFEVDAPSTQRYKKRRTESVFGSSPRNLTYLEMDFNRDSPEEPLLRAGYRAAEKTCFILEGISMYVEEQGVRLTLRSIAQAAPRSTLVMDYTSHSALAFLRQFPLGLPKFAGSWGEPWIFGLPDGDEEQFFRSLGLEPLELLPVFRADSIRRYLTRANGTVLGAPGGGLDLRLRFSPEAQSAAADFAKSGSSFYSLAELVVPDR